MLSLAGHKVVIFGASGFIGSHFCNFLKKLDCTILKYDIKGNSNFLDVRKSIEIEGAFSPEDIIINLAAVHKTPGHLDREYFETNIRGAENVCSFAEEKGINKIIFTSSIAPYGASEHKKAEDTLPTPNTPYGISKLAAEYIHKEWVSKSEERKLMILRPGVVFGKGENGNFTRLAAAVKRNIFFYPGRRDTTKACIYVKELVYQSWNLFQSQKSRIETYNFVYSPSLSIEQIIYNLGQIQNSKVKYPVVPSWFLHIISRVLKLSGIGKTLGIHPDRVKKLMVSTNISGKKLHNAIGGSYKYEFSDALNDWFNSCDRKGLF